MASKHINIYRFGKDEYVGKKSTSPSLKFDARAYVTMICNYAYKLHTPTEGRRKKKQRIASDKMDSIYEIVM